MESAAVGAIPKFQGDAGSVLTNAVHAGENVVGTVERAAVDAMHSAETMLAGVGESAKLYMPNMPNVGAYFGGAGPDKATTASEDSLLDQRSNNPKVKRPYRPRPPLVSSNSSGSFVTSGLDAPNSRSRSRLDLAHSDVSSTQLASGMATPSSVSSDMTGSSQPYKLPNVIKREYAKSVEFDMYGDEVKTEDFLYENDFSSSDTEGGVHHPHGPHHHHHHHRDGLRHPHVHAEEPVADIPSTQRSGRKEVDLVTGVDGVTFHRTGQNGKLPGYPTEEGMKRLISDRIKADKMREAQDGKGDSFFILLSFNGLLM
ncbi:hypothetical protein CPC08DRAFT_139775 [Agrocybe pediades]|nr:hypothetical protein CPC08DRAFT_139775 [Agrocybe pediades]